MTAEFERELRESLYIHRPLPLHRERSLEAGFPEKKVLAARRLYGGETMRNFVAVANIGVDPRLGDYELEELVQIVHHQLQLSVTPKTLS